MAFGYPPAGTRYPLAGTAHTRQIHVRRPRVKHDQATLQPYPLGDHHHPTIHPPWHHPPASERNQTHHTHQAPHPLEANHNSEHQTKGEDNDQPTSTAPIETTDEEELKKAQKVAAAAQSPCYAFYLTPELSTQRDKKNRFMIAYPCKMFRCGIKINRPTSDSSCGNLNKHRTGCIRKQNQSDTNQTLALVGIKGTGDIDPKEVPQLCAIWCAESARPFSALVESSHQAILHPTVIKNLPTRHMVSKDIHQLAIQQGYKRDLAEHKGALYLGVDAWQSPNGFDILAIVIYRLVDSSPGDIKLEAMPLDFIRLSQSHTGKYLAETVAAVVEKFNIQHKICGIVSDNASNNKVMVSELKKQKWARFKGKQQWLQCFAHVLNLIVQGILRPFGTQKQAKDSNKQPETPANASDYSDSDHDSTADNVVTSTQDIEDSSSEGDQSSEAESLEQEDREDLESLDLDDIEQASNEGEDNRYTTKTCKTSLAKFRAIAKKLKYSPNSKAEFVEICREKGTLTPHNVKRDVRTRWNSTHTQVNSIVRCEAAILVGYLNPSLVWQRHKRHGIERKHYLDESDFALARDLANLLNIFYEITLQLSISGSARLANIVVFIDQITEHLSTVISGSEYPPALKNACRIGLKITNKYYSLTDCSPLYRIAIVLHPSFRDEYFKLAQWEPEWISEAIRLTREMWLTFYKPQASAPMNSSSATTSSKHASWPWQRGCCQRWSLLLRPFGGVAGGGLILDNNEPINPLKWWIQQKRAGNTHGGLVNMALDVLSCPVLAVIMSRPRGTGYRLGR
ncbi:uncharacterized protein PGTG_10659 [Puccinia graminis f. sp. tritici CRL 75-36-700-3]|uniref:DUF659 domain-containing protein n=1 Tax=Puccinia graminis f. sp. tritici (strain CRL 75-36-700-3 / race SCCL) TaxID=418459 RepID=E3KJ06_PUCGT|nr:uncharacterized protein PGTG_10659 [Puccinia graminis f. sp. tritici CRL 75-36-700-3]EFP84281.2 hypothetical protein PGTG_10659 [Puccinia graminis f. sp. tritici CRL 75-36-700-3]